MRRDSSHLFQNKSRIGPSIMNGRVLTLSPDAGRIIPPAIVRSGLLERKCWTGWKWSHVLARDKLTGVKSNKLGKDGQPLLTKVPCSLDGVACDSGKAANWHTYGECWAALGDGTGRDGRVMTGVGLAMAGNPSVGGVGSVGVGSDAGGIGAAVLVLDIDKCRDRVTGVVEDWAIWIVEACQTYTEVSPSGSGLRLVGGAGGWVGKDGAIERQRRWTVGVDALGKNIGVGETYYGSGFATITFQALAGYEGLWSDIGAVAGALEKRRDDHGYSLDDLDDSGSGRVPGVDPVAPLDVVIETLGYIPNGGNDGQQSWDWWNLVGMCVFRSCSGSEDGLAAWDAWSALHPIYETEETCFSRWNHWLTSSPPTACGFGSLLMFARKSQARMGVTGFRGGPLWIAYDAARRGGGLGVVPVVGLPGSVGGSTVGAVQVAGGAGAVDTRPLIMITGVDIHVLVDMAEAALLAMREMMPVFQRGEALVMPSLQEVGSFGDEKIISAQFVALKTAGMRDVLSQVAIWQQMSKNGQRVLLCDPPETVAKALLERVGRWRLPVAVNISTLPTFRPDGSLILESGYDSGTGIYVMPDPDLDFGRIRKELAGRVMVRADAERSLVLLEGLLREFPFVEESDRAVALSALITPVVRGALDVVPLHAFNAPEAGGGKTYLASLCAALTLGRPPHVFTCGENEAELEKRIGTVLMKGVPIAVVDNLNGPLDGSFLCVAVEQRLISVRVLGLSKHVELANGTCFYATGNNIMPINDTLRRVLVSTVDPNMERPELRRFVGNPRRELIADREKFLVAVYTLVMAHAAAGFPGEVGIPSLGSYSLWSRYVRGALVWLGRADPVETMERSRALDPDKIDFRDGMELILERQRIWNRTTWTVAQLVSLVNGQGAMTSALPGGEKRFVSEDETRNQVALREWVMRIAGDKRGIIDQLRLGNWFRRRANRVTGVLKLIRTGIKVENSMSWSVVSTLKDVKKQEI